MNVGCLSLSVQTVSGGCPIDLVLKIKSFNISY